jgi:hypothetical protein
VVFLFLARLACHQTHVAVATKALKVGAKSRLGLGGKLQKTADLIG